MPLSTQVYKRVPVNLLLVVKPCDGLSIPTMWGGGDSRSTPSRFAVLKLKMSTGLMGHLACMQTLPLPQQPGMEDSWPGVLIKRQAPGILINCEDGFSGWFDHPEKSFSYTKIKLEEFFPPLKTSCPTPRWKYSGNPGLTSEDIDWDKCMAFTKGCVDDTLACCEHYYRI